MIKVGILGKGTVGNNLFKILNGLKHVEVKYFFGREFEASKTNELDLIFLALPHGEYVEGIKCKIIDMSANHRCEWTYGLPELFSEEIKKAKYVANPGCYATAAILGIYPLKDYLEEISIVGISGYSGAGKNPPENIKDNIMPYKPLNHFHNDEIKKITGKEFCFTPNVVDVYEGLVCIIHAKLTKDIDVNKNLYNNSFTKIVDYFPNTKEVLNTPNCVIGIEKVGKKVCIMSALDNLNKGAATQAIENMNLMFGYEHHEGLK